MGINKFYFYKKLSIISIVVLAFACSSDVLEPTDNCATAATYSTNVKTIIDDTCAYSGCHNGEGSAPGDYRTYAGLQRFLTDGSFVERVIDIRDNPTRGMPPNRNIYPESLQDDLTAEQLDIITCWVQNNFPE